jgi:hypothetical protein
MNWMKLKTAGLPRWAWISLFSGAVVVGLYLRSRHTAEGEEEVAEEPEPSEDSLASYEGTETAGGLAAAGLIGPAAGSVLPVEAPYIPQGFVDIFQTQGETLTSAVSALAEREPGERVEVIKETEPAQTLTGGGPTTHKPSHKPPQKHPPKKHKPQKHPKQQKKGGNKGGNKKKGRR